MRGSNAMAGINTSMAQAFLEDIRANPDDDVPRLVYADWLEDNEQQPRAELIRTQCELTRLEKTHWDSAFRRWSSAEVNDRVWELVKTEHRLFQLEVARGTCGLPVDQMAGCDIACPATNTLAISKTPALAAFSIIYEFVWIRGFVETVRCSYKQWLDCGKILFARHPLRRVELSDREPLHISEFYPEGETRKWKNDEWLWHPFFHGDVDRAALPWEFWRSELWPVRIEAHRTRFASRSAAEDALSTVCLNYAKEGDRS